VEYAAHKNVLCIHVCGCVCADYPLHMMLSGLPQVLGQNISVLLDFNGLAGINFWIYCCGRIDRCHAETV